MAVSFRRTAIFHFHFQRTVGRGVLSDLHGLYAGHHLCRCAQRRGACFQGDDAGAGGAFGGHCGLLGHAPGCVGRREVFLVPNVANFSWMTVVTAMGQMFYSLSIAMGILVTLVSI